MTYTRKILAGVGIVFIMNALANVIAYITRIYLARSLTPSEYGLFYAVFTFVLFLLFFRDLGLNSALTKYIAEYKVHSQYERIKAAIQATVLFQIISSVILVTVLFFMSNFLAKTYFKNPTAEIILNVLLIYVILSVLFRIPKSIFKGFQNFKIFSLFEFSKNSIVLLSLIIIFSLGFKGEIVPTIAFAMVPLILFFLLMPFALKTFPYFKHKSKDFSLVTKSLFAFGIPVIFTGIGSKVISYIDTILLTHYVSLDQVGIYNVILPSALLFQFVGIAISSVIFPVTAELWAKKDVKKINIGINLIHKYLFFFIVPILISLVVYAKEIILLLFGQKYIGGSFAFQILLLGVMLYIVAGINNNIISGIGKPQKVTMIIVGAAIINLILNLILIPSMNIVGAAIATSVSYIIVLLFSTIVVVRLTKSKLPILSWSKVIFLGGIFYFTLNKLISIITMNIIAEAIIGITISGIIYVILGYLFNVFSIKEIKKYITLARKKKVKN